MTWLETPQTRGQSHIASIYVRGWVAQKLDINSNRMVNCTARQLHVMGYEITKRLGAHRCSCPAWASQFSYFHHELGRKSHVISFHT